MVMPHLHISEISAVPKCQILELELRLFDSHVKGEIILFKGVGKRTPEKGISVWGERG